MNKQEQIEKLSAKIVIIQLESLCKNRCMPTSVEIAEALIKDKTVVTLPCKLGDKFWYIREAYYPYRRLYVAECQVDQFVIDNDGLCVEDRYEQLAHPINTIYFSKEEAEEEAKGRADDDK